MPLNLRGSQKQGNFNVPVSYRIHDKSGKFLDARNVQSTQGRLDTRFGTSKFNAVPLDGPVKSLSFFVSSSGVRHAFGVVGDVFTRINEVGAHDAVLNLEESGFNRHFGITGNDRHFLAFGGSVGNNDGLYAIDASTIVQLGQRAPLSGSYLATLQATGGTLPNATKFKVYLTYYSTDLGEETSYKGINSSEVEYSSESEEFTTASGTSSILLQGFQGAENAKFDKIRIYLKNTTTNGGVLFVAEIDGSDDYTITEVPTSIIEAPLKNGAPLPGGGKYLALFNSQLVYTGNAKYPNEVYFSEEDQYDIFNVEGFDPEEPPKTLAIPGQGPTTGLAVGFYGDSVLDPFLAIFKKKSTFIYSEIGGQKRLVRLDEKIGCVSHDTIQVKNGVIYFLSEEGWRAIINGRFVTSSDGRAATLSNGDIDDIFKSSGYAYEVNRNGLPRSFSVYYPTLDQYITWVSEGANDAYTKAYSYEFEVGGFKPYEFATPATCATIAETSAGRDIVLLGTSSGYVLKHSIMEERSDVDPDGNVVPISAFAVLPWSPDESGDFDATYSFRELILKAINSENALTVKTYIDYNLTLVESADYSFASQDNGFILDQDQLDVDALGDERSIVTSRADINRVGETIAIGFYQSIAGSNMGLVSMQIDSNKNGNRNRSNDNGDEEGGFDADTSTYLPSVSESVQQAAAILQEIQNLIGNLGSVVFSGYSARFDEMWDSNGVSDTFEKILQITYAGPLISLVTNPASSIREKGTLISSILLTATTTKRSNDILKVRFFRDAVEINEIDPATAGGGVETYTDNVDFSDTVSFYAEAEDDTSTVQSNTITHTFVYPYYYGSDVPGITAAQVAALTKLVIVSTASLNRTFTPIDGDVFYFAYPATYGALTSILDENGFETIGDWTLRTENITGLDGNPVSYRIYEFNNPVAASTTNYTFVR